ncbi:hypothetical protein BS47DRAFT_1445960, partial [Hydnum rufescens UP504]
ALQDSPPQYLLDIFVDGEGLAACILTKLRGQLNVCGIKAPGFGDNRRSILGDLGLLTGGTVFSDDLEIKLGKAVHDLLGSTDHDSIPNEDTIYLNGDSGNTVQTLLRDPTMSEFNKTKPLERLLKLSRRVAVIKVGSHLEVEIGEKDQDDDALDATRAAVEYGVVPDGGVAVLK